MKIQIFYVILIGMFVTSCSSLSTITSELPNTFTTENIMKTHEGMTSDQIQKIFGTPKKVSQAVCGAKHGNAWNCITWEYGEFPYDRASFIFNGSDKKIVLNNFDIHRKVSGLSDGFTTENVMKIKQGISSSEILKMFGYPASVRQAVCGADTDQMWLCTTWEYGEFPYDRASFTFSGERDFLILNNFSVDRK